MKKVTIEQAVVFYDSQVWMDWTDDTIVAVQLYQDRVVVPFFSIFHAALCRVLGRFVQPHELAYDHKHLKDEFEKKVGKDTIMSAEELFLSYITKKEQK